MSKINDYDSGLLNDFGGGNISWWQDYIRSEVGRCNDYWRSQLPSNYWTDERIWKFHDFAITYDSHTIPLLFTEDEARQRIIKEFKSNNL
jgi:hypothetical protein